MGKGREVRKVSGDKGLEERREKQRTGVKSSSQERGVWEARPQLPSRLRPPCHRRPWGQNGFRGSEGSDEVLIGTRDAVTGSNHWGL